MRTNPRPTADTLSCCYPDDYGPYTATQVDASAPPSRPGCSFRAAVRRIIPPLNDRAWEIPRLPPGRMLEIGCACGSFLHHMTARGWHVEGIEFSPFAAAHARRLGYTVYCGAVEDMAETMRGPFDLVTGWMVLEHLHEPLTVLRKLGRWTRRDGRLAFSVPDCSAWEFRVFGRYWSALHLPAHLYHYTPRTLERILCETGWRMDRILGQRNLHNLLPSIGHLLREKRLASRLAQYIETPTRLEPVLRPLAWLMGTIRQSGRITVWATRVA